MKKLSILVTKSNLIREDGRCLAVKSMVNLFRNEIFSFPMYPSIEFTAYSFFWLSKHMSTILHIPSKYSPVHQFSALS